MGLGQGPNVVLDLVQKAGVSAGSEIFFDNLFTSFPLLDKLSELSIAGTGTVRQNRLHGIPIVDKKELEKKTIPRGTTDLLYRDDQVLVAWKDNKAVYMASNKYDGETPSTCRRFSRTDRKNIQVKT